MALWKARNPSATVQAYNAEYSRVYESLYGFLEVREAAGKQPDGGKTTKPLRYALSPGKRQPKHRPQTKGAFGKPRRR